MVFNATFTLHWFSLDFHSPTGFAKSPTNGKKRGKFVLINASKNHAVWIIKDAIWEYCRHAKYLEQSAIQNLNSDKKYCTSAMILPMREQDTGQWEVRGGVIWNIVCGPNRVVGESSYCKVMQVCNLLSLIHRATKTQQQLNATPDSRAVWNNSDPTTLKIVQCELGITEARDIEDERKKEKIL